MIVTSSPRRSTALLLPSGHGGQCTAPVQRRHGIFSRDSQPWKRSLKRQHTAATMDRQGKAQSVNAAREPNFSDCKLDRRKLLQSLPAMVLGASAAGMLAPAGSQAALLQFPATELKNDYYLVRAGEGQSEADGFVFTNPVYKTSMYSGLTPQAREQVARELVPKLRSMGACTEGCWIWPSISQRSYQTAEILATQLGLSRSRIVPEYSFLDARGLGDYEGMKIEAAAQRVADGDASSPEWRPPKGSDGTPHESVADVLVRGRQVLSICETQFRNSEILIVSPDSDNLSILQAAILGVDLRQHARFAFSPGEVRPVQLSTESANYGNSKFACPNPPRCTN